MKRGVLLINLGTPEGVPSKGPSTKQVRKYLAEFLMDPYVIDINYFLRWLLVRLIIVPFRSPKTRKQYETIWTERGSPLLFHTLDLRKKLQEKLGASIPVAIGMRYGTPSIKRGIEDLIKSGCDFIDVLPLYPQYSTAATLSSIEKFKKDFKKVAPKLFKKKAYRITQDFYNHPAFIEASAEIAQPYLEKASPDHVLFSFHGLPERQIKKLDTTKEFCITNGRCCEQVTEQNALCYRAQCYASARLIAGKLALNSDQYSVCFQSRLGRTPWITPHTDELYESLPKTGVKRILVMNPSFTADCLETLEEVMIRGTEQFKDAGGENLELAPCLNSDDRWVSALERMLGSSSTIIQ